MEGLTRLVSESLARHGFDRPLDYRRLHWSRWFRCESHHSLLFVPSKPGVFAIAEEIVDLGIIDAHVAADALCLERSRMVRPAGASPAHVATGASPVPRTQSEAQESGPRLDLVSDHDFRASDAERPAPNAASPRRLLAVAQFFEDDDMAFVLDRMLSRENPMRNRLMSGRYFVRFVVIEDESQRRSICAALNQWMANSAEKATGIGPHFATSLELTPATEYIPQPNDAQASLFADLKANLEESENRQGHDFSLAEKATESSPALAAEGISRVTALPDHAERSGIISAAPHLDSGAASNIHCPSPLPSGF